MCYGVILVTQYFFIIVNKVYIVIKPTSFLSCYIINIIFIVFKKKKIFSIMLRS